MDRVSRTVWAELNQTLSLRGRRSRNKVSVGEPAEGSFLITNARDFLPDPAHDLTLFSEPFVYYYILYLYPTH